MKLIILKTVRCCDRTYHPGCCHVLPDDIAKKLIEDGDARAVEAPAVEPVAEPEEKPEKPKRGRKKKTATSKTTETRETATDG